MDYRLMITDHRNVSEAIWKGVAHSQLGFSLLIILNHESAEYDECKCMVNLTDLCLIALRKNLTNFH